MWLELAYGGFLLADYIYHRATDKGRTDKPAPFAVPQVAEGSAYPLIYGRCRVRRPVLAWLANRGGATVDDPSSLGVSVPDNSLLYGADMLFIVGLPFDQEGAHKLFTIWAGDIKLPMLLGDHFPIGGVHNTYVPLEDLDGFGDHERDRTGVRAMIQYNTDGVFLNGEVEFLDGRVGQEFVGLGPTFTSKTFAADRMILRGVPANTIPGYRSKVCVLLTRRPVDSIEAGFTDEFPDGFAFGFDPRSLPPFSFETWSTKESTPIAGISVIDSGDGPYEANPIDVIYDILVGRVGKLGISPAYIDRMGTFRDAALQLIVEGHGYSCAIEDRRPAEDHIADILRQIDATLYVNPHTGKIEIALIRKFTGDPTTIPRFHPSYCKVSSWALNGWNGVNKVGVRFENRSKGYATDTVFSADNASTVTQGGQAPIILDYPGVKTRQLALIIAEREALGSSRPLARCRVTTHRGFGNLTPGKVVSLTEPEYGVDEMLFRIADVDRGNLRKGEISFDLIQDIFYVHRGEIVTPSLPPLPGTDPSSG